MSVRKTMMAAACAASMALGGCATTGGIPSIDPASLAQIQAVAQQVCGFLPTATTVASILAGLAGASGSVVAVSAVANQICAAVAPARASRRLGAASGDAVYGAVGNIPVVGHFTR